MSFDADLEELAEAIGTQPPLIVTKDRDLGELGDETLAALVDANDPAVIFRHAGTLARVVVDDDGAHLEPLSRTSLRGHLARIATWVRPARQGDGMVSACPSMEAVDDVLSQPSWPGLPPIERVVSAPVFAPDGSLADQAGYHQAGRVWYEPGDLVVPAVPEHPSGEQVDAARRLIRDELLGEFPFVADADKAHAVALLLAPFVRSLITGPTPLHLIEAPSPGVGKGLLTEALLLPALGRQVTRMAEGRDEDEWRKRLTAGLLRGSAVALIDNLRLPLDSGALAAAITAEVWEDRLLGRSEMVRARVRTVWAATGNNPVLSTEMARRSVRIRLDAGIERPWLRVGWRHPDLLAWATQCRGQLVGAALTLVRAWLDAGRPDGRSSLGMFESWARVLGGILEVAEVPGFLGNLSEFYAVSDGEGAALGGFVSSWWAVFGERSVAMADLWPVADSSDLDLGSGGERSQRTRLGKLIGAQRDRVVGDWRVVSAGVVHSTSRWRLEPRRRP